MRALDFEFDSLRLSDLGMSLAKFDGGGMETIDGAQIEFNTVSSQYGMTHHITSIEHDCLTFTLQICKNLCEDNNETISLEQSRDIYKWLSRKEYKKLKFIDIDGEYSGLYLMCVFNIRNIVIDGRLIGFELEGTANSPYFRQEDVTIKLDIKEENLVDSVTRPDKTVLENVCIKSIYSKSDEEGYVYPNEMEIIIKKDGILKIYNTFEDRLMVIENCTENEVININYPMIFTGDDSHKIQNDFNWVFPRIASSFRDKLNNIAVSLPCSIEITYSPIVKVGI